MEEPENEAQQQRIHTTRIDDRGRDHRNTLVRFPAGIPELQCPGKNRRGRAALSTCRTAISETVQSASSLPIGGEWVCESKTGTALTTFVEVLETSDEGAVRAKIQNVNSLVNGQHILLRPWPDLNRTGPVQAGDAIAQWDCGPDPTNTEDISAMLPGSCREDAANIGATSGWASAS